MFKMSEYAFVAAILATMLAIHFGFGAVIVLAIVVDRYRQRASAR